MIPAPPVGRARAIRRPRLATPTTTHRNDAEHAHAHARHGHAPRSWRRASPRPRAADHDLPADRAGGRRGADRVRQHAVVGTASATSSATARRSTTATTSRADAYGGHRSTRSRSASTPTSTRSTGSRCSSASSSPRGHRAGVPAAPRRPAQGRRAGRQDPGRHADARSKYWVDEMYQDVIVEPLRTIGPGVLRVRPLRRRRPGLARRASSRRPAGGS